MLFQGVLQWSPEFCTVALNCHFPGLAAICFLSDISQEREAKNCLYIWAESICLSVMFLLEEKKIIISANFTVVLP